MLLCCQIGEALRPTATSFLILVPDALFRVFLSFTRAKPTSLAQLLTRFYLFGHG